MSKVIQNGDVIVGDNDLIYGICSSYDYQGKTYIITKELDENYIETGHSDNPKIVFEEVVEGEEVTLIPVEDKQLANYILANYNK